MVKNKSKTELDVPALALVVTLVTWASICGRKIIDVNKSIKMVLKIEIKNKSENLLK
jgi:uncharacterized membrane protein YhaH (DUF805 family)